MTTLNYNTLKLFGWLLWRNLRVLKEDFLNNAIDAMIVPSTFILVGGYILPYLGMPDNYGAFMIVSSLVLMCSFATTWRGSSKLIQDIDSDKAVSYELTLPIPSWLIFVKYAVAYACDAMFLNILTLPLGKLLLWHKFSLAKMSLPKFLIIYVSANLLFAFYAVWIASWAKGMQGFTRYWLRYGSQLMFFSGFQFPWSIFEKASPLFAHINLLNPFVYAFEGARASVLGQEGSLNYWWCLAMMWLYIIIFGYLAKGNFKKRLDYVG
jgi:ABC-type polysaccharide/polyol phosphate export permease